MRILTIPLLVAIAGVASAQQPPTQAAETPPSRLQTEIIVPGPYSPKAQALGPENFTVSLNKKELPFQVSQPLPSANGTEVPTHLLIILLPGLKRPESKAILDALKTPLQQGWYISVNRPDGHFTPWCNNSAALSNALALAPPQARPPYFKTVVRPAIRDLEGFAGRRVLLLVGNPAKWQSAIANWRSHLGEVYLADGGLKESQEYYFDNVGIDGGDVTTEATVYKRAYIHGIAHERKFTAAMKDIVADAHNYYYLTFNVPYPTGGKPVTIAMHHAPTALRDMYLLPADKNFNRRINTGVRLRVIRKIAGTCSGHAIEEPSCNE